MTDLQLFSKAMDGEWIVERYGLTNDDKLVVFYRSLANPDITWSHQPFTFETTPAVGTVGRIGFFWEK